MCTETRRCFLVGQSLRRYTGSCTAGLHNRNHLTCSTSRTWNWDFLSSSSTERNIQLPTILVCCSGNCCRCLQRASYPDHWRCSWSIQCRWVLKNGRLGSGGRPSPSYLHMRNSRCQHMQCYIWRQRPCLLVAHWHRCKCFHFVEQHIGIQWNCMTLRIWR